MWARVSSAAGINDELRPLLRMTASRELRERGLDAVVVGERLCRSWVLLFGVLPVDYDDITLLAVRPGVGFHESSPMLSQRRWDHERILGDVPGCEAIGDCRPRRGSGPTCASTMSSSSYGRRSSGVCRKAQIFSHPPRKINNRLSVRRA